MPERTYVCLKFSARPRTAFERASLWRNFGGSRDRPAYPFEPAAAFVHHAQPWVRRMVDGLAEMKAQAARDAGRAPFPDADINGYVAAQEYREAHGIARPTL